MSQGTVPFHNTLIIAFDFDETLGPSTFPQVLAHCGFDADDFDAEQIQPLFERHGWEKPLASTHALVTALEAQSRHISESDLQDWGARCPLYTGVEQLFGRLRLAASDILPDSRVEFHLITAGFAELPSACAIADEFEAIWGGAYHFDDAGHLRTAKRILTDAEKPRYLLQIAKGLPLDEANPTRAYLPRDMADWKAPIDQMIYVGDGSSDLPAFEFVQQHGGIAIGVHHSATAVDWAVADQTYHGRKVENIAAADYSEGAELLESLLLAVRSIAHRMRLRQFGIGQ